MVKQVAERIKGEETRKCESINYFFIQKDADRDRHMENSPLSSTSPFTQCVENLSLRLHHDSKRVRGIMEQLFYLPNLVVDYVDVSPTSSDDLIITKSIQAANTKQYMNLQLYLISFEYDVSYQASAPKRTKDLYSETISSTNSDHVSKNSLLASVIFTLEPIEEDTGQYYIYNSRLSANKTAKSSERYVPIEAYTPILKDQIDIPDTLRRMEDELTQIAYAAFMEGGVQYNDHESYLNTALAQPIVTPWSDQEGLAMIKVRFSSDLISDVTNDGLFSFTVDVYRKEPGIYDEIPDELTEMISRSLKLYPMHRFCTGKRCSPILLKYPELYRMYQQTSILKLNELNRLADLAERYPYLYTAFRQELNESIIREGWTITITDSQGRLKYNLSGYGTVGQGSNLSVGPSLPTLTSLVRFQDIALIRLYLGNVSAKDLRPTPKEQNDTYRDIFSNYPQRVAPLLRRRLSGDITDTDWNNVTKPSQLFVSAIGMASYFASLEILSFLLHLSGEDVRNEEESNKIVPDGQITLKTGQERLRAESPELVDRIIWCAKQGRSDYDRKQLRGFTGNRARSQLGDTFPFSDSYLNDYEVLSAVYPEIN
jgi:hypothetical protein